MKKASVILSCLFVLASAATSNATIIVTTSFIQTNLTATTASYTVRATFSTSGAANNLATSYGFRVAISGATVSSLTAPIPGAGVGFIGNFTSNATVGSGFVDFIGQRSTASGNIDFSTRLSDGAPTFREMTFDVARPLSGTTIISATASGIGYAGSASLLGAAAGGNGFVVTPESFPGSNIGTPVVVGANFSAPATSSITAVPEPSSVGLLAVAGIFGLGIRMRNWRFKSKSAS